ncbi:hypothetical protein [Halovenus amylolytica]|uniref:hypothetical protein n=1 Tax=Halovenus amylolytica TaxID=2500550 RepID=UPI003D6A29DC
MKTTSNSVPTAAVRTSETNSFGTRTPMKSAPSWAVVGRAIVLSGVARELDESGLGPGAMAAIGSVALALHYYVRGEIQRGQFVGLWPATGLALVVHLMLDRMKQTLRDSKN